MSLLLWVALHSAPVAHADEFGAAISARDWRTAAEAASAGTSAADQVKLGQALSVGALPYAALLSWEAALATDAKAAAPALGPALEAADIVRDDAGLMALLSKGVPPGADARAAAAGLVLQARAAFLAGELPRALTILEAVPLDAPAAAEALALRGVILNHLGKPKDALAPLLTAQGLGERFGRDARFRDQLDLNVARSYYAGQNFVKAIEYDAKVDPGGAFWLQAQAERAWAHFMLGDMPGAVGLLYNHKSPFFADRYLVETHLLRAQSLFLLCYYDAAVKEIDDFDLRYGPYLAQLDAALPTLTPAAAWALAVDFADAGNVGALPAGVFHGIVEGRAFLDARSAIAEAERERAVLARERAPWADALATQLERREEAFKASQGARVIAEASRQRAEIAQKLQDVKITRLDVMRMETQRLERAAVTGQLQPAPATAKRKAERRRGTQNWAFQGEYWADELGSYRMVSPSMCPDEAPKGPPKR